MASERGMVFMGLSAEDLDGTGFLPFGEFLIEGDADEFCAAQTKSLGGFFEEGGEDLWSRTGVGLQRGRFLIFTS